MRSERTLQRVIDRAHVSGVPAEELKAIHSGLLTAPLRLAGRVGWRQLLSS
jgi:hypothetical protein